MLILSMIYEQFRAFHSAENRDRNFCPIDLKFGMTILDQIFEVPYKFLRDWTIFGWVMLFLVSNYWFVKIDKKLKCPQWRHFLFFLKENYRGPPYYEKKASLRIWNQKLESFRVYLLQSFQKKCRENHVWRFLFGFWLKKGQNVSNISNLFPFTKRWTC